MTIMLRPAETKTVLQELTRKLGIKSAEYTIIKNGYKAESEDLHNMM
jgi:hypothetical protein